MPAAANRVPDTNFAADDHPPPANGIRRFGAFELDVRAGELHKDGLKIKLQGQPIEVLIALLEHHGEIVTREQLRQRLWPSDTFVDFEHNLNSAVKRLREALGDSADNPRFVETLPRHGYRFIAPVAERARPVHRRQFRIRAFWIAALAGVMIVAFVVNVNLGGMRQRLLGRAPGAPIQSLAVLPLENLSGNPEEEYFADGMTEELITELGRIRPLRVISRQSVMQYKGTNKSLPQIASELHVEALVQGSALRADGRVRITTQLIRAVPEEHLWAQSYERDLRDVIALQGEVARDIAGQIKTAALTPVPLPVMPARPVNVEAYNAYLQGQYSYYRYSEQDLVNAITYYEQAVKLDPSYALAWGGLAEAQRFLAWAYGPNEEFETARETAQRALALDPNLAQAHAVIASIKRDYEWDWAGANESYENALALEPGNARILREAALLANILGRKEEALAIARRAIELNPLDVSSYNIMALAAGFNSEAAATALGKALEINPQHPFLHSNLSGLYLVQSRPQEALAEILKEPDPLLRVTGMAEVYHSLGQKEESDAALSELIAKWHAVGAYQIAEVYAYRGEADEAFRWLETAYAQRDPGLIFVKGLWKNLGRDQRYSAFLKKMHLPM